MQYQAILLGALALPVFAADLTGTWKADFTGDLDSRPKTVSEIILDLKAEGGKITGTAHMGAWPGTAPISSGKIEGDRISFVVVGGSPWTSRSPGEGESSGLPRLSFTGSISAAGNSIALSLDWDSVMLFGRNYSMTNYRLIAKRAAPAAPRI